MRYCDYALGEFKRLTNQQVDFAAASIPERDQAITRALEWIKTRAAAN
jgi:hypothetical protein